MRIGNILTLKLQSAHSGVQGIRYKWIQIYANTHFSTFPSSEKHFFFLSEISLFLAEGPAAASMPNLSPFSHKLRKGRPFIFLLSLFQRREKEVGEGGRGKQEVRTPTVQGQSPDFPCQRLIFSPTRVLLRERKREITPQLHIPFLLTLLVYLCYVYLHPTTVLMLSHCFFAHCRQKLVFLCVHAVCVSMSGDWKAELSWGNTSNWIKGVLWHHVW